MERSERGPGNRASNPAARPIFSMPLAAGVCISKGKEFVGVDFWD